MTSKKKIKQVRELGNAPQALGPNEETGISKAASKFVSEANAKSQAKETARSAGAPSFPVTVGKTAGFAGGVPPRIQDLLFFVKDRRSAAREGDESAFIDILVLAEQLCEAVDDVRLLHTEIARACARKKVTWPCLLRNREDCLKQTVKTLKQLELGQGLPGASHLTTVTGVKGQKATAYLNLCAEDALKDIVFLRLKHTGGSPDDLAIAASRLSELDESTSKEWGDFAFKVLRKVTNDKFFEHPDVKSVFEAGKKHYLRITNASAKRTFKNAQGDAANEWNAEHQVKQRQAAAEKTAQNQGVERVRQKFIEAFSRVAVCVYQ